MSLQAKQDIFRENDPADTFVFILNGLAKLVKHLPDGRQQIVSLKSFGSILGRFDQLPHSKSCRCLTPTRLCLMPREVFTTLLRSYPRVQDRIIEELFREVELEREWVLLLGRMNAEERVMTFILSMAGIHDEEALDAYGGKAPSPFDLFLTRRQIADFVGLTTESVCRVFSNLIRAGAVEKLHHRLVILDWRQFRHAAALRPPPLLWPGNRRA